MSARAVAILSEAVVSASDAVIVLETELAELRKSSKDLSLQSHAEVDKKRALAASALEAWQFRVQRRAHAVECEYDVAALAIDDAIAALEAQREDLSARKKEHAAAWQVEVLRLSAVHEEKISELTLLVSSKAAFLPSTSLPSLPIENEDLTELRFLVTSLQGQLASQQEEMRAAMARAEANHAGVIAQWKEAHAVALLAPPPAVISADEVAERTAHCLATKDSVEVVLAVDAPATLVRTAEKIACAGGGNY